MAGEVFSGVLPFAERAAVGSADDPRAKSLRALEVAVDVLHLYIHALDACGRLVRSSLRVSRRNASLRGGATGEHHRPRSNRKLRVVDGAIGSGRVRSRSLNPKASHSQGIAAATSS